VVGSGAVGLYLAALLAESGVETVVLESGGFALANFPADSYACVGRRHEGIRIGRSRSVGGTSNLWGGQLVEFRPHDMDGGMDPARPAWPVSFAELKPHYRAAFGRLGIPEDLHGDDTVWGSILGGVPRIGPDLEMFLSRWMNVPSMARLYRKSIEASPRLLVVPHCTATGFRCSGSKVLGVQVRTADGQGHVVGGDAVVLASGTVETCRLMLSAAADGGSACPWGGLPMLGRRFQDHLGGRLATIDPIDRKVLDRWFCSIRMHGLKFQPKLRFAAPHLAASGHTGVTGIVNFQSSISENLVYLKQFLKAAVFSRQIESVRDFARNAWACSRHLPPLMWAYVVDHRILSPRDAVASIFIQAEQIPLDDSRVSVDPRHRDEHGLPRVLLDWRVDGREIRSIRDFLLSADSTLRSNGVGTAVINPRVLAGDASILDSMRDTNHPAGGCIMGRTPEDGVVDADLRVFGTDNLYISGAATFPTSSDSNVTFTAIALATRLAGHIRSKAQ
jgi:choline dehydrogenase-like flavoprotein